MGSTKQQQQRPPPMATAAKRGVDDNHHNPPSSSAMIIPKNPTETLPPKKPTTSTFPSTASAPAPLSLDVSDDDSALRHTDVLSRRDVLRCRSRRLKVLARYYRDQYWALMEEVWAKHRDYYWKYGNSPVEEEGGRDGLRMQNGGGGNVRSAVEGSGETGRSLELGFWEGGNVGSRKRDSVNFHVCAIPGCKLKAVPLSNYCHPHILSDTRQTLYTACTYVIKSGQTGPINCRKPVLKAAAPSLCSIHFQNAQRHLLQALKKAGLNLSSSSMPAPKFHVIIAEYVQRIQAERRDARLTATEDIVDKNETG